MLYFSCAEIGTMGEDSATVPIQWMSGQAEQLEGDAGTLNEGDDTLMMVLSGLLLD